MTRSVSRRKEAMTEERLKTLIEACGLEATCTRQPAPGVSVFQAPLRVNASLSVKINLEVGEMDTLLGMSEERFCLLLSEKLAHALAVVYEAHRDLMVMGESKRRAVKGRKVIPMHREGGDGA
jgi:hypothetical protein